MAFRDDEGALRAKIDTLTGELREAREELAALKEAVLGLRRRAGEGARLPRGEASPCPCCGGSRFDWGELGGQHVRYLSSDAGWVDRNLSLSSGIRARRCEDCKVVLIFDS